MGYNSAKKLAQNKEFILKLSFDKIVAKPSLFHKPICDKTR